MKTMTKITKRGLGAAALALSLVTAACDEAFTGPDLDSSDAVAFQGSFSAKGGNGGHGGGSTKTTTSSTVTTATTIEADGATAPTSSIGLVPRKWPIDRDVTRTALIGPEGGYLNIGETGFQLEIPAGALAEPTVITVTAKAGEYELYEFGPHGLTFDLPVKMSFSIESVQAARELVDTAEGVYLDQGDGLDVLETFPLDRSGFWVIFSTTHFSRYALMFSGWALATN